MKIKEPNLYQIIEIALKPRLETNKIIYRKQATSKKST